MTDTGHYSAGAQQERDDRAADRVARLELADRVKALSDLHARWVLYRLTTGSEAVRADLAECLDVLDRRAADQQE